MRNYGKIRFLLATHKNVSRVCVAKFPGAFIFGFKKVTLTNGIKAF